MENKDRRINARLSEEEYTVVNSAALKSGISLSDFIRRSTTEKAVEVSKSQELPLHNPTGYKYKKIYCSLLDIMEETDNSNISHKKKETIRKKVAKIWAELQ